MQFMVMLSTQVSARNQCLHLKLRFSLVLFASCQCKDDKSLFNLLLEEMFCVCGVEFKVVTEQMKMNINICTLIWLQYLFCSASESTMKVVFSTVFYLNAAL